MKEALLSTLRKLRLSGLAQTLEVRLQEAASHNLSHAEFLELILQDELSVRNERLDRPPGEGGGLPRAEALDGLRVEFQSVDQEEAGLRPGLLPVHSGAAGRAVDGAAGRGQVVLGPGVGLRGDQAGLRGPLPLDLRRGAGLPARRSLRRRGAGAGKVSQAGPPDHRRHGHEAVAEAERGDTSSRSSCGVTRPARR